MALLDGTTSSLNVFDRPAQPSILQSDRLFSTVVEPRAMFVILGPGDVLVMPLGWFHAMKSLSEVSPEVMIDPILGYHSHPNLFARVFLSPCGSRKHFTTPSINRIACERRHVG